jgi:hypothetical protein
METAEEFQQRIADFCRVDSPWGQALYMVRDAIEKRDNATRLALLTEIMTAGRRRYLASGGGSIGHTYDVVAELLAKCQAAEAQPVQQTEEKR